MPFVSTNEDLDGAMAAHLVGKKTYTRVFKVRFDSAATPESAATASGIPVINDDHNENANAKCIKIDPQKVDESRIDYVVQVDYETRTFTLPPSHPDPLDDPPTVNWGHWTEQKVVDKDNNGVAITNSAGDVYDPPPAKDRHKMQVTIIRNEATYDPEIADNFLDSVNDDDEPIGGWTISTRNGKMIGFSAVDAERDGTAYKIVTYIIQVDGDTWDLELLDQGLRQYDTATGSGSGSSSGNKLIRMKDDEGEDITTPRNLDGNGIALATDSTPVFNAYRWRDEKDWSTLNLPV